MSENASENRRGFLKLAAAAPAAAAAAVVGETAQAEEAAQGAGEGLRKTAHVKAYLETARF